MHTRHRFSSPYTSDLSLCLLRAFFPDPKLLQKLFAVGFVGDRALCSCKKSRGIPLRIHYVTAWSTASSSVSVSLYFRTHATYWLYSFNVRHRSINSLFLPSLILSCNTFSSSFGSSVSFIKLQKVLLFQYQTYNITPCCIADKYLPLLAGDIFYGVFSIYEREYDIRKRTVRKASVFLFSCLL